MTILDNQIDEIASNALIRAAKAQKQIDAAERKILSARRDRAVAVLIATRHGQSMRTIAEAIGVSHGTVQNILKAGAPS